MWLFLWVSVALSAWRTSKLRKRQHWSPVIRLIARWNGSSTNEDTAWEKKRLDADEVDSTHLQPDPRGMETEGQERFVLLDNKNATMSALF